MRHLPCFSLTGAHRVHFDHRTFVPEKCDDSGEAVERDSL